MQDLPFSDQVLDRSCHVLDGHIGVDAAVLGLAHLPEGVVETDVADKHLVRMPGDWCQPVSGYHLYYPSRRQPTPAFALLIETLRPHGSWRC